MSRFAGGGTPVANFPAFQADAMSAIGGRFGTTYFASNQSFIYFGNVLIDEALACSYSLQQSKIPIYGYNSQYFDAVADGKILVQGSLSINYIDSAYLFNVLSKIMVDEKQRSQARGGISANLTQTSKGLWEQTVNEVLSKTNARPDASTMVNFGNLTKQNMRDISQYIASNPSQKASIIEGLRKKYWDTKYDESSSQSSTGYKKGFGSNFDLRTNRDPNNELFGRPDQAMPVSITVLHGNPQVTSSYNEATFRVLRDVHFLGITQEISPTGQCQSETYSFIAKSIDM